MRVLFALLLDPGTSFASYVLRVTVVMLAGASLLSIAEALLLPDQMSKVGSMIMGSLSFGALINLILIRTAILAAIIAGATFLFGRFIGSPLFLALAVAALGVTLYGLLSGWWFVLTELWVIFITAIAVQVGQRTSLLHAFMAPFAILATYNAVSILLWAVTAAN